MIFDLGRLFGRKKEDTGRTVATLGTLESTLGMLEKKEKVLTKKAAAEVERAKEFSKNKNKRAAIQCLKRKRLYEQQILNLGTFQMRIDDQIALLEGAKATMETVGALKIGAAEMKAMQKATNIDDIDKTMDEINEQTETLKTIQESLKNSGLDDIDEEELELELDEMEAQLLEEEIIPTPIAKHAGPAHAPVPTTAGGQPAPQSQSDEEDELAALQAEMAL
ncbi:OLC1v1037618C1 [Oldenlandia corymbosa var. corymbosa]|uniref:OLC1v1037618C1 n=1 Tax=Oldenlandia corymbosa var. corymbosa TaxID=529605 RepID=A0AAV1D124_OLDCO|nr:OLC1v1037618C1 [Oldenlandia corymbosa var. corymbosa]